MSGVVLIARFPFGRYAATPWYHSRREHVGNVEWPPSPWRIGRALLASAYGLEGPVLAEQAAGLVRTLAAADPLYWLPPAFEVVYAQWMPRLDFDDSPSASQRSENGHTLLEVDPDALLAVHWPDISLSDEQRALLARLSDNVHYLGQSVSVCEVTVADELPALGLDHAEARPRGKEEPTQRIGRTEFVTMFAPTTDVTLAQLGLSTEKGIVRAMPVPPGARRVEYVVARPVIRTPRVERLVLGVVHRLDGPLRPPVTSPVPPKLHYRGTLQPLPSLSDLVSSASGVRLDDAQVRTADDDGDGRAERLTIVLGAPRSRSAVRGLLDPPRRLKGPAIDCALRLERVVWKGDELPGDELPLRGHELVSFGLESARPPLLTDAITVAEAFRRRLLGVAGQLFGSDAIPGRLTGRTADGDPLVSRHSHVHFLCAASDQRVIDRFTVWCPEGLSTREREAVAATSLPALCGVGIRLIATQDAQLTGPATVWRSHTPFLPVRHPKRRDGAWRDALASQIVREAKERGLPSPVRITPIAAAWRAFRTVRAAKPGCFPALGAHGFEIEFAEPVEGPIALGRNSHFGMGLFLPHRP